jgi:D-alanyl-D-alanine carboxypeptidase
LALTLYSRPAFPSRRFLAASLAAAVAFAAAPRESAAGYADIVIDVQSGAILHQRNADTLNYPASLTKIMTLYMVFDALESGQVRLDDKLPVSRFASKRPASRLGLKKGQTIRLDDAIAALTTKSANDVATVVAEFLGGTEDNFAAMMTAQARRLGMSRTTFRNASGLPDKQQRSTARDMSILARALYDNFPRYTPYFAVRKFKYRGRTYRNHNNLLGR